MKRILNWFKSLTPKAQKQYIKDHPNSKYARTGLSARVGYTRRAVLRMENETKRLIRQASANDHKVLQKHVMGLGKSELKDFAQNAPNKTIKRVALRELKRRKKEKK